MVDDKVQMTPAVFLRFPGGYCRPVEEGDVPYIYVWVNDPDIRPFLNRILLEMFEDEQEWRKGLSKRREHNQVWMVCLDDGTRVGTIGLHGINYKDGTATTGALFGNKEHQSKGIGQKAKMVILNHAFNVLNLRLIYSNVLGFNQRSVRYSERCGYKVIATLPNDIRIGDEFYDCIIMSVSRTEWLPVWEKFRVEHKIESFAEMLVRTMHPRKKD